MTDILRMITDVARRVRPATRDGKFKSLVEEVGELATEINIEDGTKQRDPSPDGVKGEGIDVLVVIADILYGEFGEEIHSQAFADQLQLKLNKWESKCK